MFSYTASWRGAMEVYCFRRFPLLNSPLAMHSKSRASPKIIHSWLYLTCATEQNLDYDNEGQADHIRHSPVSQSHAFGTAVGMKNGKRKNTLYAI